MGYKWTARRVLEALDPRLTTDALLEAFMADKPLCSIPDCGKPYCARGYCSRHYKSIIQKGYKRPPTGPCKISGCTSLSHGLGLCIKHYKRHLKHGDPLGGSDYGVAKAFFKSLLSHADAEACVAWPFATNGHGYGQLRQNKRTHLVSRLLCVALYGEPPTPTHEAAHLCGKGHEGCVNPHHLAWKTPKANQADKLLHGTDNRGSKHCFAKLTDDDVRTIRKEAVFRKVTYDQLAARFGMSAEAVGAVYRRETYRDVE